MGDHTHITFVINTYKTFHFQNDIEYVLTVLTTIANSADGHSADSKHYCSDVL